MADSEPYKTIPELLSYSASEFPDRLAFRAPWGEKLEEITFSVLQDSAITFANLIRKDASKGDFVFLEDRNSIPWVIVPSRMSGVRIPSPAP